MCFAVFVSLVPECLFLYELWCHLLQSRKEKLPAIDITAQRKKEKDKPFQGWRRRRRARGCSVGAVQGIKGRVMALPFPFSQPPPALALGEAWRHQSNGGRHAGND